MKKLIDRWKAEMPSFWKKTLTIAVIIGSAALGLKMGISQFNLALPAVLITVCDYTIAVCCTLGLSAKLTKV